PAATMPDQAADDVKASRNSRLLDVAARVGAERSGRLAGRPMEVLVDGVSKKNPRELSGRTRCNRVVNVAEHGSLSVSELTAVRINEVLTRSLRGTLAAQPEETAWLSR